jgi:uncharacterized protein YjbJ (UPF0337 family)
MEEHAMKRDQIEGRWRELRGKIQEQWGRVTDDDLNVLKGRLEMLAGRIQQIYGISMDEAERQVRKWRRSLAGTEPEESAEAETDARMENRKSASGS